MTGADVRTRAEAERQFLDVAELVCDEAAAEYRTVCASLAVLAGIAAGDAICGHVLKERSRAQDHRQAVDLLRSVTGAGPAANALDRLLDTKDAAQYGTTALTSERAAAAMKAARTIVREMNDVLRR